MVTRWKKINGNKYYKLTIISVFLILAFICLYNISEIFDKDFRKDIDVENLFYKSVKETPMIRSEFFSAINEVEKTYYDNPTLSVDELKASKYFDFYASGYSEKYKDLEVYYTNTDKKNIDEFKKYKIYFIAKDIKYDETQKIIHIDVNSGNAKNLKQYEGMTNLDLFLHFNKNDFINENNLQMNNIYIALNKEGYKKLTDRYNYSRKFCKDKITTSAIYLLLMIILFVFICISAGHSSKKEELVLRKIDKLYFGIFVGIMVGLGVLIIPITYNIYMDLDRLFNGNYHIRFYSMIFIAMFLCVLLLIILISTARRIKSKVFFRYSIIGFIYRTIKKFIKFIKDDVLKNIFKSTKSDLPITKLLLIADIRYITISIIMVALTIIFFMTRLIFVAILIIILELYFTYLFISHSKKLHIKIDETVENRLKEMIKSERTKTELITGVSHDLKTPITSIVAYIDLLKKEELDTKAKEYVHILDKKANSLSLMVKDLFVLAKTSGGEVKIEKEYIDINKLLKQTIADMEDKIKESGFIIKEKYYNNDIEIVSDGKKLYRVMQNLIDNALKYSLANSRIYLETNKNDNDVEIILTNTASYDMNFDCKEILEKFVRADKSRTKEGSGLGLAISNSFIMALGGSFNIKVDGDQFKAIIKLPTIQ